MSYYCKGKICPRAKECERVKAWEMFPKKDVKDGFESGVWFVFEKICVNNNYEDGVFRNPQPTTPRDFPDYKTMISDFNKFCPE
jgi:hypothetical protein